tara:strand:- start:1118 stop:2473 length:1356 start_codon:yes stop_codon:yes gene_type:complete
MAESSFLPYSEKIPSWVDIFGAILGSGKMALDTADEGTIPLQNFIFNQNRPVSNKFVPVDGKLSSQAIDELNNLSGLLSGTSLTGASLLDDLGTGVLGMGVKGSKPKPLIKKEIDPTGEYFKVKGKLNKKLSDLDIQTKKDYDLIPEKKISIEDLQGKTLFPLMGDQSATGLLLGGIDDVKFKPVKLEGGANFMRGKAQQDEGSIWASGQGVITDIMNRINKIAEETGEAPDLIYSAMKKDAIDFATFPAKALARQLESAKILKKDKKVFDDKMKSNIGKPDENGKYELPADKNWVGIDSPNLEKYLDTASTKIRKKFVKIMDTAESQKAGFPHVGKTRYAITEPALRNIKAGDTGAVIGRPDLSKAPSPSKHSTYDTQIYGDYVGGLLDQVPRKVLFKDFFKELEGQRTKSGGLLNDAMKDYIFRLNLPPQTVDQELVDIISNYGLLRSK